MQGVTAWDAKDGDLTEHIYIQSLSRISGNEMKAVYTVCDKDNHVATADRAFRYYDFMPPRFRLTAPLRFHPGGSISIKDRLFAEDVLDGDLSDRIRVFANGVSPYTEGVYPVTFEVTNSLGDTSAVTLDIEIGPVVAGAPEILLDEYLVYAVIGAEFEPMEHVKRVINGKKQDVTVTLPDDGLQTGMNQVVFSCKGENGETGTAVLYVVAE